MAQKKNEITYERQTKTEYKNEYDNSKNYIYGTPIVVIVEVINISVQ